MPSLSLWSLFNALPNGSQFEFDNVERKMLPLIHVKELPPTSIPTPMPSNSRLMIIFVVFVSGGNSKVSRQRGARAQFLERLTHQRPPVAASVRQWRTCLHFCPFLLILCQSQCTLLEKVLSRRSVSYRMRMTKTAKPEG